MSLPHGDMSEPVFPAGDVIYLPSLPELERQVRALRAEFDANGPRSPEFRHLLLKLLEGES